MLRIRTLKKLEMSVESVEIVPSANPSRLAATLNDAAAALPDSLLPFQMEINRIRDEILKRKNYEKTTWENYHDLCFKYLLPPIAGMKDAFDDSKPVLDFSVR